jgi:amidohydrolase
MNQRVYIKFKILIFILIVPALTNAQKNHSTAIELAADKIEAKVIEWRHDFHQNPELGNRELRTAALVAKHLQSLGFEVKTGVAYTGVVGILKGNKPGPVMALRADMDALPVEEKNDLPFTSKVKTMYKGQQTSVMHACGHDAHTAILMGVAEILAGMKKDIKGTIKFIFQPAEEGPPEGEEGGAKFMVKEGVLMNPNVDVIFGLHTNALLESGKIDYRPGGSYASVSDFKIKVKGKPSHGSKPWLGVDPILVASQIVTNIQTIVSRNVNLTQNPAVITIGSIKGGNRPNIIPTEVEMEGDIRTFSETDTALIHKRLRQIVEKTAEAAGATATVILPPKMLYYPVTFNNVSLTERMLPSLQKAAGKENTVLANVNTGAEDFSFYAQKVPALFFRIGGLPKGKNASEAGPHHTPEFILDDGSFKTGVKAFCHLVFDYMELNNK